MVVLLFEPASRCGTLLPCRLQTRKTGSQKTQATVGRSVRLHNNHSFVRGSNVSER